MNPTEQPQKISGSSKNIAEQKRQQLLQLFPEVFNEGKINFTELKRVLGEQIDTHQERFGLSWAGKAESMRVTQRPSRGTLKPARSESVQFDHNKTYLPQFNQAQPITAKHKA